MNLVWMALIGGVMALEKLATTTWPSRVVGYGLAAIGVAVIGADMIGPWPLERG
jgi:hypothetical protein